MKFVTFKIENGNQIRRDYELLENGEIVLIETSIENGFDEENVSERRIYVYNENTENSCNLEDLLENN